MTTAVRLPAAVGLVENVTVSEVAVAAVTVPTAPLLNDDRLWAAVVSKPKPLMVTSSRWRPDWPCCWSRPGVTVATWTAVPLLTPSVVTMAVRLPAVVGLVENVTVSEVAVAAVTVPTAPSLKTTRVVGGRRIEAKAIDRDRGRVGGQAGGSRWSRPGDVATCTAAPLLTPSVVTTAVRLPAAVGLVENVTVSEVVVAAVTVPTAPSLKATVLLPAVVSKPKPLMVSVVALMPRLAVLLGHDRRDGGHLHRRAAAHAVGRDHGGQAAGSGRLGRERHGERSRGGRGDGADRPIVEDDRVIGRRRIEAKATDGDRGRVGGQVGACWWSRPGVTVATCTAAPCSPRRS